MACRRICIRSANAAERRSPWRRWIATCALAALGSAAAIQAEAWGQPTRHQLLNINPTGVNDVGIRYFNSSFGVGFNNETAFINAASDGKSLLLFDRREWVARLPKPGGGEWAYDPEFRLPFVGTGLDIIHIKNSVGESYDWEVVDGGANNAFRVVASGTLSTFGETIASETVNLVPPGTLPDDRIHFLRVKTKDTDGLAAAGKWRVIFDAVDVYDDTPIAFDDDSNVSGNWTYTNPGLWELATPDANLYEQTRSATPGPGETLSIQFTGTSVAVLGYGATFNDGTRVTGTYNWQIDGGAGGSGTVDQSLDIDYAARWPELLVNGLASGPHTLTITVDGTGTTGQFPGNLGYFGIDALAVFDSGVTTPPNANFDGAMGVDGNDFLIWQRGVGTSAGASLAQGDANADGAVNAADFAVWTGQFGTTVARGATAAAPEPTGALLWLLGIACPALKARAPRWKR